MKNQNLKFVMLITCMMLVITSAYAQLPPYAGGNTGDPISSNEPGEEPQEPEPGLEDPIPASPNTGTGIVTLTPVGGSCLGFTPSPGQGPDNWEVIQGGTYLMTISGVTECTEETLTVFMQSSHTGNFCFNVTGENGIYTGVFTVPNPACYTMPIKYKCGADQPCTNPGSYTADGPSNNGSVHLRAATFDAHCNVTGEDTDCNNCELNVTITPGGPTTVCAPNCVTLTASGATSYVWSPNGETTASIQACATGTYYVTAQDANGCTAVSNSIDVTVNPTPTCTLSPPAVLPVCGLPGNVLSVIISGPYSSIEWSVTPSSWVITAGHGTPTITYTAGASGTIATFTVVVTNDFGCSSSCSVSFGNQCEEYCSYTQGFYGNQGGTTCEGLTTTQAVNLALSFASLVNGWNSRTVTILSSEANCVISRLPAGATPSTLPTGHVTCATATGSAYLSNGKFKNNLLGQVITLGFNLRLNSSLGNLALTGPYMTTYQATACSAGVAIPGTKQVWHIPQAVLNCLGANNTVAHLLVLGNRALGNSLPSGCSATISQINTAINSINNGFDKCRILAGFGTSSAGLRLAPTESTGEIISDDNFLSIGIHPNPVREGSLLYFRPAVSGMVVAELFTLSGSRTAILFKEAVEADVPLMVEIDGQTLLPGMYLLKMTLGAQSRITKFVVIK
jgi:hypothetical protein